MASVQEWNERSAGRLPGLLGVEVVGIEPGQVRARLAVRAEHLAPNGYLHAATVVALADTACGYGCMESLPAGVTGFTTVELKSNHVGTVLDGTLACTARRVHGGRTTQVWDATVSDEASGRAVAMFRCTQLLLSSARDDEPAE